MFANDYEKLARALENILPVLASEAEDVVVKEQVQSVPTIRLYLSPRASKFVDFTGNRNAASVLTWVMEQLKSHAIKKLSLGSKKKKNVASLVINLTDMNFDEKVIKDENSIWFVEFFAPWCGHCKALAPKWAELAEEYKNAKNIKIAHVDATVHTTLARRFQIQGFPTILLFPRGTKSQSSAILYNGPRETVDLSNFLKGFMGDFLKAEQLISHKQMIDGCDKIVCVVVVLPHIMDSKAIGREEYLKELNKAVKASSTTPVQFFWMEGGINFDFEESLHLQFGFPAMFAIHFGKNKYTIHKGYFKEQEIRSFITRLTTGRVTLQPIPEELPKLKTVLPWDGKDAPVDALEELKDDAAQIPQRDEL